MVTSVNGSTTTSSTTETGSTTASTQEELQQKIQEAYAKIQTAAQQMGRSAYAQVQEAVTKLYNDYAEALKNPETLHDFENDRVQLEAMHQILSNPIDERGENAADLKKEKQAADKEFQRVTKKYEKSELQAAQEEGLKGKGDAKSISEHQERATRANEMRTAMLRMSTQSNQSQTENLNTEKAGREKYFGLAALIKAPKAPSAEQGQPVAKTVQPDAALKSDKQDKLPLKENGKPTKPVLQNENVGDEVELAEAFEPDFENPVEAQDGEMSAAETEEGLETLDNPDGAEEANSNPEESMQLVQVALATGVLQPPVTAQGLDPNRDITQVMREIDAEAKGLLEECGDMPNSAMVFVMQSAVRQAKVKGLSSMIQGNTRNGEPEAELAELKRVRRSAGLAANGVAKQHTTTPATLLENGVVSSAKAKEQLAAAEGRKIVDFATVDNDPVLRMRQSIATWNSKDAADTAGFEGRKRSEILA